MYNDYCQPFLELCAACIQSVVHFSSTLTKILNFLMNSRFTSKNDREQFKSANLIYPKLGNV